MNNETNEDRKLDKEIVTTIVQLFLMILAVLFFISVINFYRNQINDLEEKLIISNVKLIKSEFDNLKKGYELVQCNLNIYKKDHKW